MEFTSLVDTSLDLNFRPLRVPDGIPKQEVESNFIGLGIDHTPVKDEASDLLEELNRVSAENKKLTEMLTVMCQNYNALRNQVTEYMNKHSTTTATTTSADDHSAGSKKRSKAENNEILKSVQGESSSSDEDNSCTKKPREEHIKTKTTRVYVRTEASDTSLIVKDGYQWRKYGQKVTRDNPSPRAYFKCSFAPTCLVKKKVQRSVEDQSILVATYEGEHNHSHPSKTDAANAVTTSPCNRLNGKSTLGVTASVPCSNTLNSSGPNIILDLTEPKNTLQIDEKKVTSSTSTSTAGGHNKRKSSLGGGDNHQNRPEFQHFLIEQMASSLTKDPSFQAALAAAISGKFLPNNQTDK
ncbi:probable WRKY transcription factor 40 isoform X1 [Nicotiana tomentosiformis]|uniref:probable WRKY transcription factor 40 isoform X1 n=1 Tax=Nicotiana tomentosiformis TaxID=4098 RepID=UPI00051AE1B7|nr:probable WRKY transcription factor 40 [Nicotiana tomentosiformis]